MAKIGKVITDIGDIMSDAINRFADAGYGGKAVKAFHDKITRPVGKAAGNTALKAGAVGMSGAAETVDFFRRNKDKIISGTKTFAGGVGREVGTLTRAGFGAIELLERAHIIESTAGDLGKSLVGYKLTAGAKLGLLPIAALAMTPGAARDSLERRQGRNDGRTYSVTPSMTNPYEISQQIAYSQMGQSFANNAGADGDLIRAISGMR